MAMTTSINEEEADMQGRSMRRRLTCKAKARRRLTFEVAVRRRMIMWVRGGEHPVTIRMRGMRGCNKDVDDV